MKLAKLMIVIVSCLFVFACGGEEGSKKEESDPIALYGVKDEFLHGGEFTKLSVFVKSTDGQNVNSNGCVLTSPDGSISVSADNEVGTGLITESEYSFSCFRQTGIRQMTCNGVIFPLTVDQDLGINQYRTKIVTKCTARGGVYNYDGTVRWSN